MSFNILNAADRHLTPDFISKSALFLNESESAVIKALSGILPIALGGLTIRANISADDASDILDIVNGAYKNGMPDEISDYLNEKENFSNKGLTLERALFNDKLNSIISSVASFAEIKEISAATLLNISTMLVASVSGKYSTDMNLSAASLASFLHGQKANIFSSLPAELSVVAKMIGLSNIGGSMQSYLKYKSKYTNQALYKNEKKSSWGLLSVLLLILAGLAIWYYADKHRHNREQTAKATVIKIALVNKINSGYKHGPCTIFFCS